ncbi:MAG: SIR2 family protein [Candidatus Lernaella stagnicola]|nr:SIR2 family protein [Candidatus Lernaella stagnicola]
MSAEIVASVDRDVPIVDLSPFRRDPWSKPVEDLIQLLSQGKRVFLTGAGCSQCAGLPLLGQLTEKVEGNLKPEQATSRAILEGLKANFTGGIGCNIEDYMSELVDLIAIADRRHTRSVAPVHLKIGEQEYTREGLVEALSVLKMGIADTIRSVRTDVATHRDFTRVVHRTLLSGKSDQGPPVDYFTLNYDTVLEDALSLEQIRYADGFYGGSTGWWNVGCYQTSGVLARVFKLHGSVDWCLLDGDTLPRRIRAGLQIAGHSEPVLIWPATTKYRETQRDPHALMLDYLRRELRPHPGHEVVLVICGYSFGDAHINIEIDRALRESAQQLTLLVFTNADVPDGLLKQWTDDPALSPQVRVHANRGFFHADTKLKSEEPLLWWKFETLARLLGGER